ncbi:histidine kinase [Kribbella sp. NPDC049174]|uniref:sensor histidine kinase n=1 Tax=Kribbella sp. NPDC049174 TaxID=3364112 RepID=UPI00371D9615
MGGRSRRPVPAVLFGATVITEIAALVLSWRLEPVYDTLLYVVFALSTVGAGALIAQRHPENPIGWLFCGFGLLNAITADLAQGWGLRAAAEGWPAGPFAEWIVTMSWLVSGFGWTLTFLLFPTGRLPGPNWRPLPWIGAVGLVLSTVGWSLSPDRGQDFVGGRNPWAVESLPTGVLVAVGLPLFLGSLMAAVLSLAVRFRRSRGVERQQLKWFVLAASIAGVVLPTVFPLWYVTPVAGVLAALALSALPLAVCAAILRYRLYDIDLFISRTVAYATLTVLLGAAYVVLIIALGTLFGRGSAWATAAATVVCAILFRPLRGRIQDAVDRRFNRSRYDALHRMAAFLDDVRSGRRPPEDVQTVLREILADPGLELLVFLPESQRYVDLAGNTRDEAADDRHRIAIERGDQPIGIVVHDSTAELSPELLRRVVEGGGLAVEIARLRAELRLQLSEVKASRARIVAAGHAERRRIERDLHDGAQQRLVSIGLALRHAQHQLGSAPAAAGATLDKAVAEVSVAIGELRVLARGLPPTQLDAGLAPAFHDLARRAPLPVSVDVPEERFDSGVEAAAYFICCEGLTNAVKHANATRVDLTARRRQHSLLVTVVDDGVGGASAGASTGLSGLADRVAALGGDFRIDSEPGRGTTLTAELPCGS